MLDFLGILGDYDERKIGRFEDGKLIIDTCMVCDADENYETAITHPAYNSGKWVIVETYATEELAKVGHAKWVRTMTAPELPDRLFDVGSAGIKKLAEAFGEDFSQGYERQEAKR